jgi:hypothetical protein
MRPTHNAILRVARMILILVLFGSMAGVVFSHVVPTGMVLAGEGKDGKDDGKDKHDEPGKGNEHKSAERAVAQDDDDEGNGHGNGQGHGNNRGEGGDVDDDDGEIVVVRDVTPIPVPTAAPSPPSAPEREPPGALRVVAMGCADFLTNDADWESACTLPVDAARFELTGVDGPFADWSRSLVTGADGVATLDELPHARYSLVQDNTDWCHAESDRVDDAGNVVIRDGQITTVWIFNCPLDVAGP